MAEGLERQLEKAKRNGKWDKAGELANEIACKYKKLNKFDEAIKFFKEDQQSCEKIQDWVGFAVSYRNICEIQILAGDFMEAEATINKGRKFALEKGDLINLERCYKMLACIFLTKYSSSSPDMSCVDKAKKYLYKCFSLYKEKDFLEKTQDRNLLKKGEFDVMKGRAHENLSFTHLLRGNWEESEKHFRKAEEELEDGDCRELVRLYESTASYLMHVGAAKFEEVFERALKLVGKALKKVQGFDESYVNLHVLKSKLYILTRQYEEAYTCLDQAYEFNNKHETLIIFKKAVVGIMQEENRLLRSCLTSPLPSALERIGDLVARLISVSDPLEKCAYACLSIEYYETSLKYLEAFESKKKCSLISSIAQCYEDMMDYTSALARHREVLQLEAPADQCKTWSHIVECLARLNEKNDLIISEYERWVSTARQSCDTRDLVAALEEFKKYLADSTNIGLHDNVSLQLEEAMERNCDSSSQAFAEPDILANIDLEMNTSKRNTKLNKFTADNRGEYELHRLVKEEGQEYEIKSQIRRGHPLDVKDAAGWSPLGDCMENGVLSYVKLLVEAGADINQRQPEKDTPIILAAAAGYIEIVDYLLQRGANPTLKNKEGTTALGFLRYHKLHSLDEASLEQRDLLDKCIRLMTAKYRILGLPLDTHVPSGKAVSRLYTTVADSPTPNKKYKEKMREERQKVRKQDTLDKIYTTGGSGHQLKSYAKGGKRHSDPILRGTPDHTRSSSGKTSDSGKRKRLQSSSDSYDSDTLPDIEPVNRSRNRLLSSGSSEDESTRRLSSTQKPTRRSVNASLLTSTQAPAGGDQGGGSSRYRAPPPDISLSQIRRPGGSGAVVYHNVMDHMRFFTTQEDKIPERLAMPEDMEDGEDVDPDDWLIDDVGEAGRKKKRTSDERRSKLTKRRRTIDTSHRRAETGPSNTPSPQLSPVRSRLDSSRSQVSPPPQRMPSPDFDSENVIDVDELPSPTFNRFPASGGGGGASGQPYRRSHKSVQPKIRDVFPRTISPVLQSVENIRFEGVRDVPVPQVPEHERLKPEPAGVPRTINVRVLNTNLRIPLKGDNLSVRWLAEEAAKRYELKEGVRPDLELTADGSDLCPTDLLKDVLTGTETLQSNIVTWDTKPPHIRYKELCETTGQPVFKNIFRELERGEVTNTLRLTVPLKPGCAKPFLRSLKHWSGLRELVLSGCKLGESLDLLNTALPTMKFLRLLDLSCNGLTCSNLEKMSTLPPNLSSLNLGHNLLGNTLTLRYLSPLLGSASLTLLNLQSCQLTEELFQQNRTEFSSAIQGLKELNVSNNNFGPTGLEILLKCCPKSLIALDISGCVSEYGGRTLKGLLNYCKAQGNPETNLHTIKLRNCHLRDENLADLADAAFHLGRLKSLDLSCNEFSPAGLINVLTKLGEHDNQLTSLLLENCPNICKGKEADEFLSGIKNVLRWYNNLETLSFPDTNSKLSSGMGEMWRGVWGDQAHSTSTSHGNIVLSILK